MIERVGGAALPGLRGAPAAARSRGSTRDAARVQEAALLHLVRAARETEFGRAHGFDAGPLRRRLPGADAARRLSSLSAALEPRPRRRARRHVAGTSPLLGEDVGHDGGRQVDSRDAGGVSRSPEGRLGRAADRRRAGRLRAAPGRTASVPGRHARRCSPVGQDGWVGDLSGLVVAATCRPGIRGRYSPGRAIAAIPDWEGRIDAGGGPRRGPGPEAHFGDALVAPDPLRARGAGPARRGPAGREPRRVLAESGRLHPRRRLVRALPRHVRGVDGAAASSTSRYTRPPRDSSRSRPSARAG